MTQQPQAPTSSKETAGFALHITAPPWRAGCHSALAFAESALAQGYCVNLLFFSGQGVLLGNYHSMLSQSGNAGPKNIAYRWAEFANATQQKLHLCTADAQRYGLEPTQWTTPLSIGSLGQLITAYASSMSVIEFKA